MTTLLIDTTDATFDNDVLRSTLPVLLDFWAPWCGPCKALAPMLERIAIQHEGKLRIVKYDVDQNKDSMHRFKLRGVPTLIAYRAGEEVGRHAGGNASGLKLLLEALLAGPEPHMDPGTNTFGNDPARKARCIARIEQAIAEGRLGGPPQKHSSDDLPSTIAIGQTSDRDDPDVLGLPPVIDALYNYFYEMLAADPSGRQFTTDFLRSISVGVDLSSVPRDYLLWTLNDVMGQVPAESEAAPLLADLVNLHRRDALSGTVPPAQWEALQARIEEKGPATGKQDALILATIAPLATPAASIPATAFFLLIRVAVSLPVQQIASTWWTAEEAEIFDSTNRSMAPFVKSLGPRPEEPEALAEYERKKQQFIDDAWAKAYSICPTLEKQRQLRLDAIEKAGHQARTSHAQYLIKRLANS
ncbi:thioredoxin domain-containing protein [Caballeronia sp. dw_19]|uniref:thioredoxin family protein n=1 Tax=Caballeronia sp. dw_19 TaxID=2719791 RepID=UPI001BD466BA|nr:thioredoxin domain-containing protein [Caballeronia sp. dw_19]